MDSDIERAASTFDICIGLSGDTHQQAAEEVEERIRGMATIHPF
jgi:hypothetical protein